MVKHPVLIETFCRIETTRILWDIIKEVKPRILYFYSNKGRNDKPEEIKRNDLIRSWVNEIDWECDLHTWFRDEYVDVYTSTHGSKDWVFKNEDSAIILEDDCKPSKAFFDFCDHFLDEYKDEARVNYITGNNYAIGYEKADCDHYITRSLHHYGWATWADRWHSIDFDLTANDIIKDGSLKRFYKDDTLGYLIHFLVFNNVMPFLERTKCWDYIKCFNQIKNNSFCVTPIYNLVQNIGINGENCKNGQSLEFELSNGEENGQYVFLDGHTGFILDKEFERIESEHLRQRSFSYILNQVKLFTIIKIKRSILHWK